MLQRIQKPEEGWLVCIQSQEAERDEQAVSSLLLFIQSGMSARRAVPP